MAFFVAKLSPPPKDGLDSQYMSANPAQTSPLLESRTKMQSRAKLSDFAISIFDLKLNDALSIQYLCLDLRSNRLLLWVQVVNNSPDGSGIPRFLSGIQWTAGGKLKERFISAPKSKPHHYWKLKLLQENELFINFQFHTSSFWNRRLS